MRALSHIGYTLGAIAWAEQVGLLRHVDLRVIAAMSLFPDLVGRILFVFVLPNALGGRLIAHTLVFSLLLLAALLTIRRSWWIYGAASAFHLLLDSPGHTVVWARHVLWPFLGPHLPNISIVTESGRGPTAHYGMVWQRLGEGLQPPSARSFVGPAGGTGRGAHDSRGPVSDLAPPVQDAADGRFPGPGVFTQLVALSGASLRLTVK